jgi:hypothetical protein
VVLTRRSEYYKEAGSCAAGVGYANFYTVGSPEIVTTAQGQGVTMHYTDMTGRNNSGGKLPYSAFKIKLLAVESSY